MELYCVLPSSAIQLFYIATLTHRMLYDIPLPFSKLEFSSAIYAKTLKLMNCFDYYGCITGHILAAYLPLLG